MEIERSEGVEGK